MWWGCRSLTRVWPCVEVGGGGIDLAPGWFFAFSGAPAALSTRLCGPQARASSNDVGLPAVGPVGFGEWTEQIAGVVQPGRAAAGALGMTV